MCNTHLPYTDFLTHILEIFLEQTHISSKVDPPVAVSSVSERAVGTVNGLFESFLQNT